MADSRRSAPPAHDPGHRADPATRIALGILAALSPSDQLAIALMLMLGRFVSPTDPPTSIWLLGHLGAGLATGLVVHATTRMSGNGWWRASALAGGLLFQFGVVSGWSATMAPHVGPSSRPFFLCALGAFIVAVTTLGVSRQDRQHAQADNAHAHWPPRRWSMAVSLGGMVGFGAAGLGLSRAFRLGLAGLLGSRQLDPSAGADTVPMDESTLREMVMEQMMSGNLNEEEVRAKVMEQMSSGGGFDPSALQDMLGTGSAESVAPSAEAVEAVVGAGSAVVSVVPVVVVLVVMAPLAIAAVVLARRLQPSASGLAGFVALAMLPVVVAGGLATAAVVAAVAVLCGILAHRPPTGAIALVPAVILAGAALATGAHTVPLVAGIAGYGFLLGLLLHAAVRPHSGPAVAPA